MTETTSAGMSSMALTSALRRESFCDLEGNFSHTMRWRISSKSQSHNWPIL